MTLQQQTLLPEQGSKPLTVYRGGSHASRTALQESVKRLLMSVTSGRNTGESLAKLSPDGLWLKTYQGYFQAKMDGSFEEYFGTLPTWGLMLDGQLFQPQALEPYIDESGWRLLPTPTANLDGGYSPGSAGRKAQGIKSRKSGATIGSGLNNEQELLPYYRWDGQNLLSPLFLEAMMGFPQNWTETNV